MQASFTIGIEEEFQLVERQSGRLAPRVQEVLARGRPVFGDKLKPEIQQILVELVSDVFPDMQAARTEMPRLRAQLAQLVEEQGIALLSSGTHPLDSWQEEMGNGYERYAELTREFRDLRRSTLIFGLHVHIGVEDRRMAIAIMNQARTWIPHLLALSANSPFWAGRYTGLKSYRAVTWKSFPRTGVPDVFTSLEDYDRYISSFIRMERISNARSIWWDIRHHPLYPTIEFRVFDMPATVCDMLALTALCQALVRKLAWLYQRNMTTPSLPRSFIEENKWHAARDGLDAEIVDFIHERRLTMREAISKLLDFIDDVLDDLGSRPEIDHLRRLLDNPCGTGADRQAAIYQKTGSVEAVIDFLARQTLMGVPLEKAHIR